MSLWCAPRDRRARRAARDGALLRRLYDLGLRRSEVVGLDVGDVDLAAQTLAVVRKGGSRALLELPEEIAAALGWWIARRGAFAAGGLYLHRATPGRGAGPQGLAPRPAPHLDLSLEFAVENAEPKSRPRASGR
ncbi:MAG TPA: tyrosine-type recombinase/integrase [Thermoanaerobaculia bacterium]|nr:tyrosine-type recombinase/integrase [Thermoanaerobaculia bacterium]